MYANSIQNKYNITRVQHHYLQQTTGHNKRQHLRTISHELQDMDHMIEFQSESVGMEPYWSNIHF
jgi:hypothetical protein